MKTISQQKKIDLIYTYLFSDSKSIEEENFWNKLSSIDIKKLEKIEDEEIEDFNLLKFEILWK